MGKLRRGGYVLVTWKGDHPPRHVHVYREGRLVVKWDLDHKKPMKGKATGRVRKLIEDLGLEVATADDARAMLSLKGGSDVNF